MMIYHQPGEEFWHAGVCYKVGGRIVANEASDYAGLFGNILEIRTEDDRETDNDTPDIYCAFDPPVLSADRLALEQTFSQLYHEQKHIEDLGLDNTLSVYIRRLRNKVEDTPNAPKYLLTERGIGYKWVVE